MINFVALDVETANTYRGSICQIGITEIQNGKVQFSRSWLVKPKKDLYEKCNIAIHGITQEDTKK